MPQYVFSTKVIGVVAATLLLAGCSHDYQPCMGMEVGNRYELDLVEVWGEESSYPGGETLSFYSCPTELGLSAGAKPVVEVVGHGFDDKNPCKTARVEILNTEELGLDVVEWKNDLGSPRELFTSTLTVSFEDCVVALELAGRHGRGNGDTFVDSVPGEEPFFVLGRDFGGSCPVITANGCNERYQETCSGLGYTPSGCGEQFVLNVHEIAPGD